MNAVYGLLAFLLFTPAEPVALFRLRDGSTIAATQVDSTLEVKTKHGTLVIPFADVRTIEFGVHYQEGQEGKILAAIKDLGHGQHKMRDAAQQVLLSMPDCYPLLVETNSPDLEVASRIKQVAQLLRERDPKIRSSLDDQVSADGLDVRGRITGKSIVIRSASLGELTIKFSDVAGVTVLARVQSQITVEANADWVEVGSVIRGRSLLLEATGTVDLWPQQPGMYMTDPKGYTTAGKGSQFNAGALIGKYGNGEPFLVGTSHTTSGEGKLYVKVVPSPWNNDSLGKYQVRVSAGR